MSIRKPPLDENQLELFSAVFTDISTRDAQDTMEIPYLSLSKKPRTTPIIYKSEAVEMVVTSGAPYGIATIWDWDLVMWLLSQVREALDRKEDVSRKIRFHPHAFLKAARRIPGGVQYKRLEETISRLKSTTVVTTVRAKKGKTVMFSWLEYGEIERDKNGRIQYVTAVIPEWLFEAVRNNRLVLSMHRDYFLLTGGIERWLYRFVRKQAGSNKQGWGWYLRTLYEHSGSTQRFSDFAVAIRNIAAKCKLLDYELSLTKKAGQEFLHAKRVLTGEKAVGELLSTPDMTAQFLQLRTATYERAKECAPGFDVYALEADWRRATRKNGITLNDPDSAFLAWCRRVQQGSRAARR